jgi:hypothetical protein
MTEGKAAPESESARPNMCTGSGFVFVDRVDTTIRVHAHVHMSKSSSGTGFVHVHVDRKGRLEPVLDICASQWFHGGLG